MLYCDAAGPSAADFEELAVFVCQLAALGLDAGIDVRSLPEDLNRNLRFDIAPRLRDAVLAPGDRVLLVNANRLTEDRLVRLRRIDLPAGTPCLAIGAFADRQSLLAVKARLSYVLGADPQVLDLAEGRPGGEDGPNAPVIGVPRTAPRDGPPRLLLVEPDLADPGQARALIGLARSRRFRAAVLTDAKAKRRWAAAHGAEVAVYEAGEVMPASLAERTDICVLFRSPRSYRQRCLVANLAVSGAALVDAGDRPGSADGDAFIAGPPDLGGLAAFLAAEIVPNLGQIGVEVRRSRLAAGARPDALLRALGEPPRRTRAAPSSGPRRVVFMPTNGIGLGHAQRSSLIASELDRSRIAPSFAAFPSCMRMIKRYGFDVAPLIGRSASHAHGHENDLPNYLRLRALAADAAALVFDGVYVFDSVFRTVLERGIKGVWIRRGLWQAGQDNSAALDREKVFERVIVPGEAFEELNVRYSYGEQVRAVGPVVQRLGLDGEARGILRTRLAARFHRPFERLVVSLLGSGVAADRTAQIQALCGMMARRPDVLHLVVVWPTAVLHPAWFGWANSRIVKTHHAGVLAAAADLCISASGYNSFHEMLYNRVPAIFVPQMEARMDDQRARAEAARERGLAGVVEARRLMTLDREITRFLDEGEAEAVRQRLAALELPEPGNAAAARLIEEVADGHAAVELGAGAGERARRG